MGRCFFFFKWSWSFSRTDITYCGIDRLCSCIGHCKRELNPCNMWKPLRMGVKMSWNHFGPWKKIIIHLEIHKATRKLWNWHKFRYLNFPIYSEYIRWRQMYTTCILWNTLVINGEICHDTTCLKCELRYDWSVW